MRITVQVIVDTQDHTEPVVCEVFALERDALAVDLVGLHLAETHELLTALQEVLVPARETGELAYSTVASSCVVISGVATPGDPDWVAILVVVTGW